MLPKSVANKLISALRCSKCFREFDENSIQVMRFDEEVFVLKITCSHCFKSFGMAFLGLGEEDILNSVNSQKTLEPITFDDVLNAHNYIQNLDENWKNFIHIKTYSKI